MNENEPQKKVTDMEVVDAFIKRINSGNPSLRDTFLPRAKEILELGRIKDPVAIEKLKGVIEKKSI